MLLVEHKFTSTTDTRRPKCRIAEIMQYDCDVEQDVAGRAQVHCWPVPRIFRICPGRPAVEITRYVNTNALTGLVKPSPELSQFLPKGKPWRDVKRFEVESDQPEDV